MGDAHGDPDRRDLSHHHGRGGTTAVAGAISLQPLYRGLADNPYVDGVHRTEPTFLFFGVFGAGAIGAGASSSALGAKLFAELTAAFGKVKPYDAMQLIISCVP